jgi:hypothetical protein
MGKLDKSVE